MSMESIIAIEPSYCQYTEGNSFFSCNFKSFAQIGVSQTGERTDVVE
jgi:hypothetical protein